MAAKHKGKLLLSLLLCSLVFTLLVGCGTKGGDAVMTISAAEAKTMMETQTDYVILDVRAQSEYDSGHIPGATLIPLPELAERAEDELTSKDQLILVYCRSGNRSRTAAATLQSLGYTNIIDFGGINSWPYEIAK